MMNSDKLPQALKALQRLIVHAKAQAYDSGHAKLGELLDDIELLPEYLGEANDRTDEFAETMRGIAKVHPSCRYIVEEFERALTPAS